MARIEKYVEKQVPFPSDARPQGDEFLVLMGDVSPEGVRYLCPCGCGDEMYIPLGLPSPHHWEYRTGGHLIHPSVSRSAGCRSHYFINEDGTVQWC